MDSLLSEEDSLTWYSSHSRFSCVRSSSTLHIRPVHKKTSQSEGVNIEVEEAIADVLLDKTHRLVFILCENGACNVYLYNSPDQDWVLINKLSLSKARLVTNGCCLLSDTIYWQSESEGKVIVHSSKYSIRAGSTDMAVELSPHTDLLIGWVPCDLVACSLMDKVIALPRVEAFRSVILSFAAVKLSVSVLSAGIVCTVNHILEPVPFQQISLPILTALQQAQGDITPVNHVLTNTSRDRLIIICSGGETWQWDIASETFSLVAHDISPSMGSDLIYHNDIIFCLDRGVQKVRCKFIDNPTENMDLVGSLSKLSVLDWHVNTDSADVVLHLSDNESLSLNQLYEECKPCDTYPDGVNPLYEPPDSISSLTERVSDILSSSQIKLTSELLGVLNKEKEQEMVTTPLSREIYKTLHNSEQRYSAEEIFDLDISVDTVTDLLQSLTTDNLFSRVATLQHYIDTSPHKVFTAFISFLLRIDDQYLAKERWSTLFSMHQPKSNRMPLVSMFLYTVWLCKPSVMIETLLMVGCKYNEHKSPSQSASSIVDGFIDIVDNHPSIKHDKNYLLLYCKLLTLSESEVRTLQIVKLLDEEIVCTMADNPIDYFKQHPKWSHVAKSFLRCKDASS